MNILFPTPFSFPYLYYILYLYTKVRTLFPATFFPATFFPRLCLPLYISIIYTLYIERNILSRHSLPLSYTFIILLIYRRGNTLPAPFLPLYIYSYKVNTFSTAHFLTLIVWEKVCGEKFLKTLLV